MAAREYSQYNKRKQITKKGSQPAVGVKGTGSHSMPYHCPDWGNQLPNPSNTNWGSDTAKVQIYPKSKGLKG